VSDWKITGPPRFFEGVGMVYPVTKGGSRFSAAEEDELKALLTGWISVDERLPEIGVDVLVYRPRAKESHDALVTVSRRGWESKANQSPQGVFHCFECWCHPTHWMPIRELPTN
jgi:hypothetical protein